VILDTDGLSAIADGDAALEPTLRKAAKGRRSGNCVGRISIFYLQSACQKIQFAAELANSVWDIGGIDRLMQTSDPNSADHRLSRIPDHISDWTHGH
jgi:hypothetical protein